MNNNESDFGETEVTAMVASFYQKVRADDLIGPMYPQDDWEGAEERLREFLIYRFGGSDRYIQKRGHPRLGMRHAPFDIGIAERDRWLQLMDSAMQETGVPKNKILEIKVFFQQVANFLANL